MASAKRQPRTLHKLHSKHKKHPARDNPGGV